MKCKAQVQIRGMNFYRTRQCSNEATCGDFCWQHDPAAKEARQKKSVATQEKKHNRAMALYLARLRAKNK